MSASETDTNSLGFLPNLCSLKAILRVAVAAEVLAMVLALAAAAETYQASMMKLVMTSLFVQWVVISSTMSMCLYNKFGKNKETLQIVVISAGIVSFFTICASMLTIMADSYQQGGRGVLLGHPFILRNLFISLVITALALRYFYVQSQRDAHVVADTDAKYDALQSRMRPHFLI